METESRLISGDLSKYLEFLRSCLDASCPLPSDLEQMDWTGLYDFGRKQAIIGVLYQGIQRLPEGGSRPTKDLELKWLTTTEKIRQKNQMLNLVAVKLASNLKKAGMRGCLLKGQGNAMLYPDPSVRICGDIDMWVDGTRRQVDDFARQRLKKLDRSYHHVDYPILREVAIELHYTPGYLCHFGHNARLQRFFEESMESQFSNLVELPGGAGAIAVPTSGMNRIYELVHVMHHFINHGIGLRHFIDYYYLLKQGFTAEEQKHDVDLLDKLGMKKFAAGIMYVLQDMLGLPDRCLLLPPDKHLGQTIEWQVISEGNFGKIDARYASLGKNVVQRFFIKTSKVARLLNVVPSEASTIHMATLWHRIYVATH